MAMIKSGNWSFKEPPFKDGDVVEGGNCSQLLPDTVICSAVKDLTITDGNFVNCKPQPTWDVKGGNWCQISFCTHQRPDLVAFGLPVCAEDCLHRVGTIKQPVVVPVEEFKAIKADLSTGKAVVNIATATDKDGVITQTFTKKVYVYENKLVRVGMPETWLEDIEAIK